jgi:N-acetylneuraminic acid mutarotase
VRVIGHLPAPSAHAAGAALGGTFYVLGGRGDAANSQRRSIWAIDPVSGRVRVAGRLPVALSDLSAVAFGNRLIVVGGRDNAGTVHGEILELAPR